MYKKIIRTNSVPNKYTHPCIMASMQLPGDEFFYSGLKIVQAKN